MPDVHTLTENLLSQLDRDTLGKIVIVGGQALSLWAFHYLLEEMTAHEQGNITSDDLDFFGRTPEAR